MATPFTKIKDTFKKAVTTPINPHRYWIYTLRVFLFACVLLIIVSFYFLYQIKTQQIFQIKKSTGSGNTVDANLLQSVKGSLDQKAQTKSTLEGIPPMYEDPSL